VRRDAGAVKRGAIVVNRWFFGAPGRSGFEAGWSITGAGDERERPTIRAFAEGKNPVSRARFCRRVRGRRPPIKIRSDEMRATNHGPRNKGGAERRAAADTAELNDRRRSHRDDGLDGWMLAGGFGGWGH